MIVTVTHSQPGHPNSFELVFGISKSSDRETIRPHLCFVTPERGLDEKTARDRWQSAWSCSVKMFGQVVHEGGRDERHEQLEKP